MEEGVTVDRFTPIVANYEAIGYFVCVVIDQNRIEGIVMVPQNLDTRIPGGCQDR